jgi:ABC-2 type transport system ATP-binding protein
MKKTQDIQIKTKNLKENNERIENSEITYSIHVKDLKKYYTGKQEFNNVKAVDGLSFHVENGEFFGLLGPNGAGKTTTINILTGIQKPTEGTAIIGGYSIGQELNKIKEIIGVCPQDPALFKFLTGLENIEFFGKLHSVPKNEITKRAESLLKLLGLFEVRKRKTKKYSGGMLRQLSLIVALINQPHILFLDEPTVGMDPRVRRKVWKFLESIKNQKKTTILTTHYIEEAETLCDRVAIIDYGKVIALGTPQQLIKEHGVKNLEEVFLKITGRKITEGL